MATTACSCRTTALRTFVRNVAQIHFPNENLARTPWHDVRQPAHRRRTARAWTAGPNLPYRTIHTAADQGEGAHPAPAEAEAKEQRPPQETKSEPEPERDVPQRAESHPQDTSAQAVVTMATSEPNPESDVPRRTESDPQDASAHAGVPVDTSEPRSKPVQGIKMRLKREAKAAKREAREKAEADKLFELGRPPPKKLMSRKQFRLKMAEWAVKRDAWRAAMLEAAKQRATEQLSAELNSEGLNSAAPPSETSAGKPRPELLLRKPVRPRRDPLPVVQAPAWSRGRRGPARATARAPARATARAPARATARAPARATARAPARAPARATARAPARAPAPATSLKAGEQKYVARQPKTDGRMFDVPDEEEFSVEEVRIAERRREKQRSEKEIARRLKKREDKRQRDQMEREAREKMMMRNRPMWMIQKEALKRKFPEGWRPHKRLSPDAVNGIRALNQQFPGMFTTEALSQRFQLSPEAIRRILRTHWQPNEWEEQKRERRWQRRGDAIFEKYEELGIKPPQRWRDAAAAKNGPPRRRRWDEEEEGRSDWGRDRERQRGDEWEREGESEQEKAEVERKRRFKAQRRLAQNLM